MGKNISIDEFIDAIYDANFATFRNCVHTSTVLTRSQTESVWCGHVVWTGYAVFYTYLPFFLCGEFVEISWNWCAKSIFQQRTMLSLRSLTPKLNLLCRIRPTLVVTFTIYFYSARASARSKWCKNRKRFSECTNQVSPSTDNSDKTKEPISPTSFVLPHVSLCIFSFYRIQSLRVFGKFSMILIQRLNTVVFVWDVSRVPCIVFPTVFIFSSKRDRWTWTKIDCLSTSIHHTLFVVNMNTLHLKSFIYWFAQTGAFAYDKD